MEVTDHACTLSSKVVLLKCNAMSSEDFSREYIISVTKKFEESFAKLILEISG